MKPLLKIILSAIALIPLIGNCQSESSDTSRIVYQSDNLIITRLTENAYVHISYFDSEKFGRVPCNGLIVTDKNEAIIFDTPADDTSSAELIDRVSQGLNSTINAIIPTHFHEDCVGGLREFHKNDIPSYASKETIALAKIRRFNVPLNTLGDSLTLAVGSKKVYATFLGEGHTKDNVVGYFPSENILFGGCLIKSLDANKGNLEDANVEDWSYTVKKVKNKYPTVQIIVPGHGAFSEKALLDYTIELFRDN